MANNYGVANTVFKPFSFEEMLRPALMATKSLEELEAEKMAADEAAALSALDFKGSKYENKFNDYLKSLSGVADYINKGDIQNAKRAIKSAKNMYINTLVPAQQRIKRLNTLREKQNTEESANPFVRFDVDYRNKTEDDITTNSSYTSYDLNKIYKQIATDTMSRISSEYRPQVGNPIKVSGTNSYLVTNGYGMTQEEYNDALKDPNSDLTKFVNSEIKKATSGITNQSIIDEITQGVKDVIKSNIGKFEQTKVEGTKTNRSDFLSAAKAAYEYKWGVDENGNPVILGRSDQWFKDKGWKQDANGEWYNPYGNKEEGMYHPNLNQDPDAGYKEEIPSFKGGYERVKKTQLDTKLSSLGKNKLRESDIKDAVGNKMPEVIRFSHDELLSSGIDNIENIIRKLTDGNPAEYYNFYYSDDTGRGGTVYSVKKSDEDIKTIINNNYIYDLKANDKHKGIYKQGDAYYYIDSDGKFLLDKNKQRIKLDLLEVDKYIKNGVISKDTPSGKRIFFKDIEANSNKNEKNNESNKSNMPVQKDSTIVTPIDSVYVKPEDLALPF